MRILQLTLLVACLSFSSAWIPKSLVKKLAMVKIAESCIGRDTMVALKEEMKAACEYCHGEGAGEETIPNLAARIGTMINTYQAPAAYRTSVQYVPVPIAPSPYGYMHTHPYGGQRRWRRGAHYDPPAPTPEKIAELREQIEKLVSNVTCVMRTLNLLDNNNQVDFASIKQRIMNMPVSKQLQDDMCDGMDQCRDFASCIPSETFEKIPIMSGFGKQMAFFKCFKKAKLEACMKQEFRNMFGPELGRSGLPEDEVFHTYVLSAMLKEEMDM